MRDVQLKCCTPEPLMSYLKALGVFRLLAEQADPGAKLSWRGGSAQLQTTLTREELVRFFVERYRPTPLVAPWNGGSGFYGGGSKPLEAIEGSRTDRLALFREVIKTIRPLVPRTKPKDEQKAQLLLQCRAQLGDEVIPWLDVCFVLSEAGPSFFPLLGTGGNDGRLDFTNNFMQRLADVLPYSDGETKGDSSGWLSAALFGDVLVSLEKAAVGQFNPGGTGGANGIQGRFEADSRVNPWDFVLMVEGTLLFAGSIARRMGSTSAGRAVFPFSVDSVAVGYGSASSSEETSDGSRAELWLPLWDNACTLAEVRHLFAEGRAQLGRRQAKHAVEFALAINLLGVNKGISSFTRYGFLKRNGLAFLASPLGQVKVQLRPSARLLDEPKLANWIDKLRSACRDKDKTPARYQTVLRQLDRAVFAFSNRSELGNDTLHLLDILSALGRVERTLSDGLAFCKEKRLRPLQGLSSQWLDEANDGTAEWRLAISLAGIRTPPGGVPLRGFLEAVEVRKDVNWSPASASAVWSRQSVAANLAAVFRRRLLEVNRAGSAGMPLCSLRPARLADVLAFLNGECDDDKLSDLLWGLLGVAALGEPPYPGRDEQPIPIEFGIPRLLVENKLEITAQDGNWKINRDRDSQLKPDPDVFHLLGSGQLDAVAACVTRAGLRLKASGLLVKGYRNRGQAGKRLDIVSRIKPERLLAAMLFPLSTYDLERIADAVLYPPDTEET